MLYLELRFRIAGSLLPSFSSVEVRDEAHALQIMQSVGWQECDLIELWSCTKEAGCFTAKQVLSTANFFNKLGR